MDIIWLGNLYLTTALKCVPPGDKPQPIELKTCFKLFKKEIDLLSNVNIIVALGKIAFDACLTFYKKNYNFKNKEYMFIHGAKYKLPDQRILVSCYHPSPRNVNTKRINIDKMLKLFNNVKKII